MEIDGIAASEVRRAPPATVRISARFENLVDDISRRDPTIIGLGEATHGTAEFVQARGELTLALIRSASVRLLLFEVDAISASALDDYVNGADVDLAKALPALGFWITDTYEFRRFLELVRQYNAGVTDKVHLWGSTSRTRTVP
jgi:erythromycin esterase-like protein